MEKPLMSDPEAFPTNAVLEKYMGKTKSLWDAFMASVTAEDGNMQLEWRYYRDGKTWLGKLTHKKKTLCWISVWDEYFKMAFYFSPKNDHGIQNLAISQVWKARSQNSMNSRKIKALTIEVKTKKALQEAQRVLGFKLTVG